ncbi:hypothetical protein HF690_06265 [Oleiagrimonas citrea]|uniref:Uncharacterized protein n=1 Tax=Oleiagrimonas citrea TaxID=1665687 RepID=A0A846ZLY7_9GAMM|nr:hypothetical protein [Oleiagrimonas citrea]NKZ38560.1 hypothetical protein [Oleiagrimonas citrea]
MPALALICGARFIRIFIMCSWHHNAIRIEQTPVMRLRDDGRVPFVLARGPMHSLT